MSAPRLTLPDLRAEWLEADGLGGFASGTVSGIRTRRYHALLLAAMQPPGVRVALVQGCEARIETGAGAFALSSQRYAPDVVHPDGASRIVAFEREPWPRWTYALEGGVRIEHEIFAVRDLPLVVASWRLERPPLGRGELARAGDGPARLVVRPLLSGRDPHSLHHENGAFRFGAEARSGRIEWRLYDGVSAVLSLANAEYRHAPDWYRRFLYEEERARGLDFEEDLASPGELTWDLARGEAAWLLAADTPETRALLEREPAAELLERLRAGESKRRRFATPLHRAAGAYIVKRGAGRTIAAGYPWFGDWGRDTFIALRGLCLAGGRLEDARGILLEWSGAVSEGMLPNRFADQGDQPEFNSVDASLWYVIAVHDYLAASRRARRAVPAEERGRLEAAVEAILEGYSRGTRHGIRMDGDGLLAAGAPGVQLTWMDARIGDWVVTPRSGKPVEIQALWINALWIGARMSKRRGVPAARAMISFAARFWNEARACLYDVVDVEHRAGEVDASLRPNQILALGGLPYPLLEGERARRALETIERELWTPLGPRSLAPGEPGYAPRYEGGVFARDSVYHQGTVWPWLAGPFVEAWVRVRGDTAEARRDARARFLAPLLTHLDEAGLGHVSEIADAEAPHLPRGCPFQAWSMGELLRLDREVLGPRASRPAERAGVTRARVRSGAREGAGMRA